MYRFCFSTEINTENHFKIKFSQRSHRRTCLKSKKSNVKEKRDILEDKKNIEKENLYYFDNEVIIDYFHKLIFLRENL